MSDILTQICKDKLEHIKACQLNKSLIELEEQAKAASAPRGFARALETKVKSGEYGLIAEIKKASPSKGLIRKNFNPKTLARSYKAGGAACLSVLTDKRYFQGSDEYLQEAREIVDLPVLRKDFMLDPYQIVESRALGADCVLLIMAALEDSQAQELEAQAIELGMDVLIEVHSEQELERALALKSQLLGINNRNLKTLVVDITTTEVLASLVPEGRKLIAESGLKNPKDLARMAKARASCFLIGESLMKQDDVETATKNLLRINHG
jgi:indole-3-glycerol phosphate synthase